MRAHKLLQVAGLAIGLMALSACGNSNWVKNVQLKTFQQNNSTYAEVTTAINSNNVQLTMGELVFFDKNNPTQEKFRVRIEPGAQADASNVILVFNVDDLMNDIPPVSTDDTLPNGLKIPVAGLDKTRLLTFIKDGSKVYVTLDPITRKAMVGVAIAVDKLGTGAQGALFFPFAQDGFSGSAGIFLGPGEKQSGFGLFADISGLFGNQLSPMSVGGGEAIKFPAVVPSSKSQRQMQRAIRNLQ